MALNEEQINKLRPALASSAWREVMWPALRQRANDALKALVMLPSERKGDHEGWSDDGIRARIRELEWMLSCWQNEVAVFDYNRSLDGRETENGANPQ